MVIFGKPWGERRAKDSASGSSAVEEKALQSTKPTTESNMHIACVMLLIARTVAAVHCLKEKGQDFEIECWFVSHSPGRCTSLNFGSVFVGQGMEVFAVGDMMTWRFFPKAKWISASTPVF